MLFMKIEVVTYIPTFYISRVSVFKIRKCMAMNLIMRYNYVCVYISSNISFYCCVQQLKISNKSKSNPLGHF